MAPLPALPGANFGPFQTDRPAFSTMEILRMQPMAPRSLARICHVHFALQHVWLLRKAPAEFACLHKKILERGWMVYYMCYISYVCMVLNYAI